MTLRLQRAVSRSAYQAVESALPGGDSATSCGSVASTILTVMHDRPYQGGKCHVCRITTGTDSHKCTDSSQTYGMEQNPIASRESVRGMTGFTPATEMTQ